MRQLARLVDKVRQLEEKPNLSFQECISGRYFDTKIIVDPTTSLCQPLDKNTMNGVKMSKTPSLGLHLGHSIIKCCHLKRGMAIRLGDHSMKEDADNFQDLFRSEWNDSVSSQALQTLKERRYTATEKIPTTADLILLRKYTDTSSKTEIENLQKHPCASTWRSLAKTVFVIITVFNQRRGGEVAKMRVQSFLERSNSEDCHADIAHGLSNLEKKLVNR